MGTVLPEQESTAPGGENKKLPRVFPGQWYRLIIGEAIASPQLSLYKRKIFVYNRESCNEHIIDMPSEICNSAI